MVSNSDMTISHVQAINALFYFILKRVTQTNQKEKGQFEDQHYFGYVDPFKSSYVTWDKCVATNQLCWRICQLSMKKKIRN